MFSPYPTAVKSFCIAAMILLAGCNSNPVRDAFAGVGAGPPPDQAPEFVQRSRPAQLDYIPVGRAAPERATTARTADEVKAAEAELERVRSRNEAARNRAIEAGSTPPPEPATADAPRKRPAAKTP